MIVRFAPALATIPAGALLADDQGIILAVNPHAEAKWGAVVGASWAWLCGGRWSERHLREPDRFDGEPVTIRRARVETGEASGWFVTWHLEQPADETRSGEAERAPGRPHGELDGGLDGELDALLRALPLLTWVIDEGGVVRAQRGTTAQLDRDGWIARPFLEVASSVWNVELDAHVRVAHGGRARLTHFDAWGRSWELHLQPLAAKGEGGRHPVLACAVDVSRTVRLERALMEAQQLESIGALAGGLAHEINTPMQYLGDNLQFLQMVVERFDRAQSMLCKDSVPSPACVEAIEALRLDFLRAEYPGAISQSLEGIERVSGIVEALKASAKSDRSARGPSDFNRIVNHALRLSENTWKYVARVERDLTSPLPLVSVDAGEIMRALLNLILNAAEAIRATHDQGRVGLIHVRTFFDEEVVGLELEDDGGGIPANVRGQIFDHFFTTKERGVGRGQGLASARAIFEGRYGGTLTFKVKESIGTTFRATLPRD